MSKKEDREKYNGMLEALQELAIEVGNKNPYFNKKEFKKLSFKKRLAKIESTYDKAYREIILAGAIDIRDLVR